MATGKIWPRLIEIIKIEEQREIIISVLGIDIIPLKPRANFAIAQLANRMLNNHFSEMYPKYFIASTKEPSLLMLIPTKLIIPAINARFTSRLNPAVVETLSDLSRLSHPSIGDTSIDLIRLINMCAGLLHSFSTMTAKIANFTA